MSNFETDPTLALVPSVQMSSRQRCTLSSRCQIQVSLEIILHNVTHLIEVLWHACISNRAIPASLDSLLLLPHYSMATHDRSHHPSFSAYPHVVDKVPNRKVG